MSDSLFRFILAAVVFALLVMGGYWVIGRSGYPKPVLWGFGAIVLIIIVYALLQVSHGNLGP